MIGLAAASGAAVSSNPVVAQDAETIPNVAFDSTSSLLNASMEPLTDESLVAVWAENTATTTDSDGNGDTTSYGQARIHLVVVDRNVLGFSAMVTTELSPSETVTSKPEGPSRA